MHEQNPRPTAKVVSKAIEYLREMESKLDELSLDDYVKALDMIIKENHEFFIKYEGFTQAWRAKYGEIKD